MNINVQEMLTLLLNCTVVSFVILFGYEFICGLILHVEQLAKQQENLSVGIALTKSLDINTLKLYKLRGESVIFVSDLPNIPECIRRYKLRGKDVVKLSHLTDAIA